MTDQVLLKEICDRQGALDYADLTDIGCAAELICALDNGLNDLFYLAVCRGKKRVIAKTAVRRCKKTQCHGCDDLHLCKFYLLGECKNSRGRRRCPFGHDLHSEHNSRVLSENSLERLNRHELRQLLLQNDNSLIPPVCYSYNKGTGPYGNCPDQEECRRVHVCDRYIRGTCQSGADCYRCHDFFEPHPFKILQQRGVPNTLMSAMLSTYQNILAMKGEGASGHATISQAKGGPQRTGNTDICLFFVKGDCNQGEKCWRVHSKLPYKWEIKAGPTWLPLADNEAIEKDFCDPSKTLSEGSRSVCFDSMNCGSMEVRRLSTISSVLQPKYILTTNWAWFWKDEYNQWIKYASIKEMHRLSSIASDDLEAKYQEDPNAVVKFSADKQFYELSFKEMTQTNELYDTVRLVRRRPAFVSAAEAQTITRWKNGPRNNTQNVKAVPGFWDMSAIPDIGYKPVSLGGSDRDYQKVQGLFKKTMAGFHIIGIDRVQNRDLWEDFQRKRDRMKKNNGGKISKELTLFHGTDPKHIEDICRDNFDWRLCGTNGTVYGQGSYFARDAKYSHSYTGDSGVRSMFSCRVLVGNYTQGNSKLRRPPSKGEGNPSLYDSCVDNVRDPSIYVVFERHQVYPEFLIKYDDGATSFTPLLNLAQSVAATTRPKTVSIQSLTLTSSAALNPVVAPAPLSQMFSPYKTAATMTFYQTPSHPTSSSANQILPSAISHPSLTPMKPAPRSKLASTASNTVGTPASTPSNTVGSPASTPSNTVGSPASTPSNTVGSPASTPSNTVGSPASTPSNTVSTPASTPSYTVSTPASNPASKRLTAKPLTPSRLLTPSAPPVTPPTVNMDYTLSFAQFCRTASTHYNTVSTPASTPSYTVSTPASTPSYTVSTPASNPASKRLTAKPFTPSAPPVTPPPFNMDYTSSFAYLCRTASTHSNTVSTPSNTVSTPSNTVGLPATKRLAPRPPTSSTATNLSGRTLSSTLSPSTSSASQANLRTTDQPLSPSLLSSSSSARTPSLAFSPSTGGFCHPQSAPTRNISELPYRPLTAPQRKRDANKKKCLLQ